MVATPTASIAQTAAYSVVGSWNPSPNGNYPIAPPIVGADGNLYGVVSQGGPYYNGMVYQLTTTGSINVLHWFTSTDGAPRAGLVQGSDGAFYGTTMEGGAASDGTVFRVTSAGSFSILHQFSGSDGQYPMASLIQASDGNLYGTTWLGGSGSFGYGTIFRISLTGAFASIYNFDNATGGRDPQTPLVEGVDDNLYGTASAGGLGSATRGTVFEITFGGVVTNIHSFTGTNPDGSDPGPLTLAADGTLYGTTSGGGVWGRGTAFHIATGDVYSVIHQVRTTDPYPLSGLIQATDGNFYGAANFNGPGDSSTLFRMTPSGTMTTIYALGSLDGDSPSAVVQAPSGTLYGVTTGVGPQGGGTVFSASTSGTFSTVYAFATPNGDGPGRIVQGPDGAFYGKTVSGGTGDVGTVFRFSATTGYSNLKSFNQAQDGVGTTGPVVFGQNGNLYGETGTSVFSVNPNGSNYSVWSASTVGSNLLDNLIFGTDGNLYGVTDPVVGVNGGGLFKFSPSSDSFSLFSTLVNDTASPYVDAGLTLGLDGNFYGATVANGSGYGSIYKVDTSGNLTVLHALQYSDGTSPEGELVRYTDGSFYGTTAYGGPTGDGTVFRITPSGTFTVVHEFTDGPNDGADPAPFLLLGSDGNFYGSSVAGGPNGAGVVFQMTPAGNFQAIYPQYLSSSMIQASDGNFYGPGNDLIYELSMGFPAAPSLSASATSASIQLQWSTAANATTYSVYRGTSPGGEGAAPVATGITATSWTDPNTLGGTTYYYRVVGIDSIGDGPQSNEAFATAPITPITTTASLAGPAGSNGWYTGAVTVTLTVTDGASTVTDTYYTIDGGAQQTYSAPFTVSGDAIHTITFWSVDAAGDTETAHSQSIKIDGTPPSLTFGAASPAANAAGWNNSAVSIPFTTADATSGVATVSASSPLSFTGGGANQTQTVTVTDNAGNSATFTSPAVNIDLTAPVTTESTSGETVTLTATDNLSGVAVTYYTLDGGAQQTYSSPFTVISTAPHTISYWSVDNAGNVETAHTLTIAQALLTTAALSGPIGSNGWYRGTVTVTLTATDSLSTVTGTYYTIDGGAQQTYSTPFKVSGDAVHTITYWSVDAAGTTETPHAKPIDIDSTPPVTSYQLSGSVLTLSATDNVSGVATTYYSVDGGAYYIAFPGLQIDLDLIFTTTVNYYSIDNAGNEETVHTLTINPEPPSTTASLSGPAGSNGWYTGPVTVTLTETDPFNAAGPTYYTIDGGARQTYSAPFTVAGDGSHSVSYWSVDTFGNAETAHNQPIEIDGTAPTLTFGTASPTANAAGWDNARVSIPFTTADATSGVATVSTSSPLSFTAEGANQTQAVTVTDIAGNSATFTSPAVNIDLTPPVTTGSASGDTVTLSATDNLSGVAETYFTVDGGAQQTYSSPFTVNAMAGHSISYWSVDIAGNVEAAHTLTVDTVPPSTTASLTGPAGTNGWYTGTVTVTLTATDAYSTVADTYYTLDGGPQQTYSWPFTVSGDGVHTITFWSVDAAGNTETAHSQTIDIDATPPVITFGAPSPAANAAGWNNTAVTIPINATDATSGIQSVTPPSPISISGQGENQGVSVVAQDNAGNTSTAISPLVNIDMTPPVTVETTTGDRVGLSATDNLSGVAATYYTVDGGAQQTYSAPINVTPTAGHTVTYWSVDVAGNVESPHTITVDTVPPTTTVSLSGPAGSNGWYKGAVTVTLSATDSYSTVTATYYTVDGGAQQTYTAQFVVSGDGRHTVTYWSVDAAGNTETAHSQPIDIDGTVPTLTFGAATPAANAKGWNNTAVSIPYTAADATSGVASSTPASPATISTQGSGETTTVTVTDNAGNTAAFKSQAVNIDLTAPSTTASVSGAQVTLSATDNLSGVAATYYTVDAGSQQTYTTAFTVTGVGSHTVKYWSVDVAGNVETSHTTTVTINPVPTASSLSPSSCYAAGPQFTLTVTGTNFVTNSTVTWKSASLATTYISSTQLSAVVPASDISTNTTAGIQVTNPAPGGGTTSSLTFTVNKNPAPTLTSISPASVVAGTGTVTLTLTGTNFLPDSVVEANGTAIASTYVSSTSFTAVVPASLTASTGTPEITLTNPTPGGGTTVEKGLKVVAATIASVALSPASVQGGASSTGTVTLTGPAPTGGFAVTLTSSSSKATLSPTTLTIAAGSSTGTFTVNTVKVTSTTTSTITAKNGSTAKTATLTITVP